MHKALGRGLESLIPASIIPAAGNNATENVVSISIDKIKPNKYQPRTYFDESKLKELCESIKKHGLTQPILVSPSAVPGEYELVAGERRWRASRMAGLKQVTAIVRQTDERQRFHLALIENIQREDLNPVEEARAFKRLADEFKHTQEELAHILNKDRSVVANSLRLLNLPADIQESIAMGHISAGHGRILAGINDDKKLKELAGRIEREKLTVREIEKIVADWKTVLAAAAGKKKTRKTDHELTALADDLQRLLGTKVKLAGKATKGRIEIHFFSLEELERITAHLKGKKHH